MIWDRDDKFRQSPVGSVSVATRPAPVHLIDVVSPTPDVIRLFLDPRLAAGNFIMALVHSLGREKASNFSNVNNYLESSLGDADRVLEDIGAFQLVLEQAKARGGLDRGAEEAFEDLKACAQDSLIELHRARLKLNDLKIALCRFIVEYEAPSRAAVRPYHSVEEWMDAAALAEMRLTRGLPPEDQSDLRKLLALFMTFRSIVCSYDG
ncbi:MAG TPA: hypothetical protein VK465_18825, partial [Fibrobacteria bacterium]|nr:hypothetical protein [Fibrobacteria bacterium]